MNVIDYRKESVMDQKEYYQDKICIVTGANSGIGYALSEELLKRGATVYMAGRNPEKVAKAAAQLSAYEGQVRTLVVDVTKQVQTGIEDTAAEAGRLDMLFKNAGISLLGLFETATLDDWKTMIGTNLWSVIYGVHAAVPIMLKQGFGHIVNTSSVGGIIPFPMQTIYNCIKYGVTGLSESLRYEYAEKGLRFSAICPGATATAIYEKQLGKTDNKMKIPDTAYPADKAASFVLDRVAVQKGIIIVPEGFLNDLWKGYVLGEEPSEIALLNQAHDRRIALEQGDPASAAAMSMHL